MHLHFLDFAVMAVFLVGSIYIGVRAGRGSSTTEDFFAGGRSMPGWAVGFSILGTCISSVTYVAYPGKAFIGDWQYLTQGLMLLPIFALGGPWIVRFYRARVKTSVNEFLEQRFGPRVRLFSFFFLLVSELARIASVTYLFAMVVNTITGFDVAAVIVVIGGATIVYSMVGGIKGVIWADVFQTIILLGGGLIAIGVASFKVPGGIFGVIAEAHELGKFRLLDFGGGLSHDTFWVLAVSGVVNYFYFLAGNQNQIQRYQCAASDREAVKAAALGSLLSLPTWTMFMMVGTSLFVLYRHHPDPQVEAFVAAGRGDKVFPYFIAAGLPQGLSGLLLVGLAAAAMSTLSSSFNTASTLTVTDFYRRFLRPDAGEAQAFKAARAFTLAWGLIGVGGAIAMIRVSTFLDFYFTLVALVIGAIAGVFALALLFPRAHERGVIIGLIAGLIVTAWGLLSMTGVLKGTTFAFPWRPIMVGVAITFTVVLAGGGASLIVAPEGGGKRKEAGG